MYVEEIQTFENKEVIVTIEPLQKRTTPQNRYYWGVVVYMITQRLNELGYMKSDLTERTLIGNLTRDDVHTFLKENFNRIDIISPVNGEVIGQSSASTKESSTKEFANYLEKISQWAAETLDIVIPEQEKDVLHENRI